MTNSSESFGHHEAERKPIIEEFADREWSNRTIGENESRSEATPEIREKMDREIREFGKLMEGVGIWWQLDGGLNISLREIAQDGDYIGIHKDIDFSVFEEDLEKFREHVESKGYGLFFYHHTKQRRYFEEATSSDLEPRGGEKFRVLAVDRALHKIKTGEDFFIAGPMLSYHGPNGEFVGWRGEIYPESWQKPEIVSVKGVQIPLSHPARFLYYKSFWVNRGKYHGEDLEHFVLDMKAVSSEGIEEVLTMIEKRIQKIEEYKTLNEHVAKRIAEFWKPNMDFDKAYAVIQQSLPPDYREKAYGRSNDKDLKDFDKNLREGAIVLSTLKNPTPEQILEYLNSFTYLDAAEEGASAAKQFVTSLKKRMIEI